MKYSKDPWSKQIRPGPLPPKERRIYGTHACRALFERRPGTVTRAYVSPAVASGFDALKQYCLQHKLTFKVVSPGELVTLAKTQHHEGICLFISPGPPVGYRAYLKNIPKQQAACVVALEAVGNPHNLGAIIRTAAHFGVQALVVEDPKILQNGAVARTAQGGLEQVALLGAPDLAGALDDFKRAGFTIATTSSHEGQNVFTAALPDRLVLLLGAEGQGLSPDVQRAGDLVLCIPGSGTVESLNVSTAAGILLAAYWRRQSQPR